MNNFDFSPPTIYRVSTMLDRFGGVDFVDPLHEDNDESVGSFIMFVIRDACDFAGLRPKKSSQPHREIQNALYKFKDLTEKTEKIGTLL